MSQYDTIIYKNLDLVKVHKNLVQSSLRMMVGPLIQFCHVDDSGKALVLDTLHYMWKSANKKLRNSSTKVIALSAY